ncbi:MAG: hypothetical protein LBU12_08225 [Deltaproteobacteria bacterium]|jgi:hypothetical protein|nr:hypothetical protein [Deltaproteobacteria bacterium]
MDHASRGRLFQNSPEFAGLYRIGWAGSPGEKSMTVFWGQDGCRKKNGPALELKFSAILTFNEGKDSKIERLSVGTGQSTLHFDQADQL